MTGSTPDDLVTTFRSLARRQREAIGDADPNVVSGLVVELQGHVAAAAAALGSAADPEAVAGAIAARPTEAWDVPTLERLRQHALDAGAVLRRISQAAGTDEED